MKVWLASSGDYSDYQVHCAFVTEELAKEYVALRNDLDRKINSAYYAENDLPVPQWLQRDNYGEFYVEERDLFDAVPVVPEAAT